MQGWKAKQAAARERMAYRRERINGRRKYYEEKGIGQFAQPQVESDPVRNPRSKAEPVETNLNQGAGGDGQPNPGDETQAVYEAKHKQFGRYCILKNGEEHDAGPYSKADATKLAEALNSGNVPRTEPQQPVQTHALAPTNGGGDGIQGEGSPAPEPVEKASSEQIAERVKEMNEGRPQPPTPQPAPPSDSSGSGETEFLSEDE